MVLSDMSFYSKFKLNFIPILGLTIKVVGSILSMIALVLSFASWEEIGINQFGVRILIILAIIVISFIVSSLLVILIFKKRKIWTKAKNTVFALYGDLFKIAFKIKGKSKRLIVIPCNDTFETIVETLSEKKPKPLVTPNSIHGEWIKVFCDNMKISVQDLNERIQNNLDIQGYKATKVYTKEEKTRGNLRSYEIGTVATIDGNNNVSFLLLAISEFDSNNNARATKKMIRESVDKLIEFYDKNGQSDHLYMPLIGTGTSRADLTHEQSLRIIKSCILDTDKKIQGEINVVVYQKDRDKVSIFK